ncbi:MAG: 16S rRNA (uracil(1498)-N(3))-methyltransferase [Acidobacteria bacterium]|nr:16S rRNA (uracil(1498)-N(3))-methyltransferase [Acidobacteriota bacterium]
MRERRFLVDPADLNETQGLIRGDELHHLRRVLRLRVGDEVSVFDGRGRGSVGRIRTLGDTGAAVALERPEDPAVEPAARVILAQAIPHGDRMDLIVEKAVEIGVAAILPVIAERGTVRPPSGGWPRLTRWRRIAVAAAKQSGRLVVPAIADPAPFARVAAPDAASRAARIIFITAPAAREVVDILSPGVPPETVILIGPEGGWSEAEGAEATAAGWASATLGPRILRADTAAVAALTLVLAALGEMRPGAP